MTIQKDHGYRRIARRPNSLSLSENNGSLFFEIGDPNGLMVDQKFNSQKKIFETKNSTDLDSSRYGDIRGLFG